MSDEIAVPADDTLRHRPIRSFVVRAGRMSGKQERGLTDGMQRHGLAYDAAPLDFSQVFGRAAPTVLEIGFGMGVTTAQIAAAMPDANFLAVEVHPPGVGNLCNLLDEQGLRNVRVMQHDAVEVLTQMIAPDSLAGAHIYFPDPWHKKRHNKRRLVQPDFVVELARILKPGARLRFATDWADYANRALADIIRSGLFDWTAARADDWRVAPADHVTTRYQEKRLGDCTPVFLNFVRR